MIEMTNEQKVLLYITKNINKNKFFEEEMLSGLDWNKLLDQSMRHKMFMIVYKFMKEYIPKKYIRIYSANYTLQKEGMTNLVNEIEKIVTIAEKNNIELLIMKGIIYSHIIYDDLFYRQCDDIDTLVKEDDMYRMDTLLRKNGYIQTYSYDIKTKETKTLPFPLLRQHEYHEFFPYTKQVERPVKSVKLEVARSLHTVNKEKIGGFLRSSQKVKLNNFFVRTFDISHTFLSLCENTYDNAQNIYAAKTLYLRDFIDIFVFLTKYKDKIDWIQIRDLAIEYDIVYQVYYVLNNLNLIYEGYVSNEIIEMFSTKRNGIYEDGSVLNWDINIIERLFCCKNWRGNTNSLIKKKSFSQCNINYNTPFRAIEYSRLDIENLNQFLEFMDNKYGFKIKFIPCFDKSSLYFIFFMDDRLTNYFDKFLLTLRLVNNNIESPIFSREVRITKYEKNITIFDSFENSIDTFHFLDIAELNVLAKLNYTNLERQAKSIFQVKFNYSDIGIDFSQTPTKLCYNILLHEKIYTDLIYQIGEMFIIWNPGTIEIPSIS